MTTTYRRTTALATAFLASNLVLAGCGDKVASSQPTPSPAGPVVEGDSPSPPRLGGETPPQPTQPGRFGWTAE